MSDGTAERRRLSTFDALDKEKGHTVFENPQKCQKGVVMAELNLQVATLSIGKAVLAKQPSWRNWHK